MSWGEIYDFAASLWVLWLMVIFIGVVVWAFWPGHKRRFQSYGDIPFKDDDRED